MATNNRPGLIARAAADAPTSADQATPTRPAELADWRATAEDAVLTLAARGTLFGADDVRALGVPEPERPNQWGAVFRALHAAGYIVPVGFTLGRRRVRHSGLSRLWVGTAPDADTRPLVAAGEALAAMVGSASLPAPACALDAEGVNS